MRTPLAVGETFTYSIYSNSSTNPTYTHKFIFSVKLNSQNSTNHTSNITIALKVIPAIGWNKNASASDCYGTIYVDDVQKVRTHLDTTTDSQVGSEITIATWTGNVQHNKTISSGSVLYTCDPLIKVTWDSYNNAYAPQAMTFDINIIPTAFTVGKIDSYSLSTNKISETGESVTLSVTHGTTGNKNTITWITDNGSTSTPGGTIATNSTATSFDLSWDTVKAVVPNSPGTTVKIIINNYTSDGTLLKDNIILTVSYSDASLGVPISLYRNENATSPLRNGMEVCFGAQAEGTAAGINTYGKIATFEMPVRFRGVSGHSAYEGWLGDYIIGYNDVAGESYEKNITSGTASVGVWRIRQYAKARVDAYKYINIKLPAGTASGGGTIFKLAVDSAASALPVWSSGTAIYTEAPDHVQLTANCRSVNTPMFASYMPNGTAATKTQYLGQIIIWSPDSSLVGTQPSITLYMFVSGKRGLTT